MSFVSTFCLVQCNEVVRPQHSQCQCLLQVLPPPNSCISFMAIIKNKKNHQFPFKQQTVLLVVYIKQLETPEQPTVISGLQTWKTFPWPERVLIHLWLDTGDRDSVSMSVLRGWTRNSAVWVYSIQLSFTPHFLENHYFLTSD